MRCAWARVGAAGRRRRRHLRHLLSRARSLRGHGDVADPPAGPVRRASAKALSSARAASRARSRPRMRGARRGAVATARSSASAPAAPRSASINGRADPAPIVTDHAAPRWTMRPLAPSDIDVVYAAANGAAPLDRVEAASACRVLRDASARVVTAIKGALGECGASGAAAACAAAILCGHAGFVPPIARLPQPDPAAVDARPRRARTRPCQAPLC